MDRTFRHEPLDDGCETCHKRHGFKQNLVLVKEMPALCIDCHKDVPTDESDGNVHEALTKGGCTVCHDPHASDDEALLRHAPEGTSPCFACHPDQAAVAGDENYHEPFEKNDCAACHAPHASSFPALLWAEEEKVCEACHENAAAGHEIPGMDGFSCSDCHDPHGASPTTPLRSWSHEPFAEGDCEACHDVEGDEIDFADDFPPGDLCSDCHDDVTEMVAGGESHFGEDVLKAGGTGTCLECHNPHATEQVSMLNLPQNDLCRGCHEDLPAYGSHKGSMHAPFIQGDCIQCHQPHGGGGSVHLAAEIDALCSSCHEDLLSLQQAEGATRHEAMEITSCDDCHSGHATENYSLLHDPSGETCTGCHDKSRHTETHSPYLTSSCESCHRNHSPLPRLLASDVNRTCGRCHSEQLMALGASHPHPAAADETCLECHLPHGSEAENLLVQPQGDLCSDCHDPMDLAVAQTGPTGKEETPETVKLHTPVARGSCGECHDPHGSDLPALLDRSGADLCYGCHAQEKLTFSEGNPHEPVTEGKCDVCHTPHGGTNRNLTVAAAPRLCSQCHDVTEESLSASHLGYDMSAADCSSCHTPHTSDLGGLIKPVVHEPFADEDCEVCHDGPEPAPGAIAEASAEACLMCHDEKEDEPGHQHAVGVDCVSCHEPHAARVEFLLDDPTATCTKCHADMLEVAGESVHLHKPIETGSCLDCHSMHNPESDGYLALSQGELCSSCHESVRSRGEDQTKHEPFESGDCSFCHDTHASAQQHLLVEPSGQLCSVCHDFSDQAMKSAHNDFSLSGRACLSCHDPHSTEAAGSSLILPALHFPYEEQDCDVCHDPDGRVTGTFSVCADCHDNPSDFEKVHNAGRPVGTSQEIGVCMDCHSPHAGHDGLFVRSSQQETCLQCHDRSQFSRTVLHGALEDGCTTCHDLHENNIADLRGANVADLCFTCHGEEAEHLHPVGEGYNDPRTGEILYCLACHEPHSSDHEKLTTFDRRRDLCIQCHSPTSMQVPH